MARPAVALAMYRERAARGLTQFYQVYFQVPGAADADLQRDVRQTMKLVLYGASGECPAAGVEVPALYMVGDRDVVYKFPGAQETIMGLSDYVPQLRQTIVLDGCGHWTQQERPAEVNAALLDFLGGLAR